MPSFFLQNFTIENLINKECRVVGDDEKSYSEQQINEALNFLFINHKNKRERWAIKKIHNTVMLSGKFIFNSYEEAFAFVSAIYLLSLRFNYYPDITFGDSFVYISLFTIKLQGIHENDFIMLVKIEDLLKN